MSGRGFWIGLLLLPLGCQSKPQTAAPDMEQVRQQEQARQQEQNWQRMKECAQQSDRMVKRFDWVEGKDGLLGWENHYSPKHGRCFVAASFMNKDAKKDPKLPMLYDQLFDAFEGRLLAICTDARVSAANVFCSVEDGTGPKFDCGGCRQWIEDRMRH